VTASIANAEQMAWIEYRLTLEQRNRSRIIISSRYHASPHQPINLPPGSKFSIECRPKADIISQSTGAGSHSLGCHAGAHSKRSQ